MADQVPCPQCGTANDASQRFCGACGGSLVLACAQCGTQSPAGFRFCGQCGAAIGGPAAPDAAPREERRVVTVLFADLVGFTSRAERLDPEDVRAMLDPYFAALREAIVTFGGTVEKFIGDAVVGVFGVPTSHGDDPERAVRAALRIQEQMAGMHGGDEELEVRIGINTGEAFVELDAWLEGGEAMVAGDVVNTAARLQTAAPANEILVGEDTYRCTCSTLDYTPVEPLTLKGKALPVPAWQVRGAPLPPGERAAPDVEMVGRDHELGTLNDVWERVRAERRPRLVTIFGLPGVGKSRLAAEFMAGVEAGGGRIAFGRSLAYGESSAYEAFGQQLEQVAAVAVGDEPEVVMDKLRLAIHDLFDDGDADEVARHVALLLGLPVQDAQDTVEDRRILFFSARRVVEALAVQRPTVLVFQDLHWADPSLLDLIETLSSRVQNVPLLVLAAARPELQTDRPGWGAGSASVPIVLEPLNEKDSGRLASLLLARVSARRIGQTVEEIGEAGEGNPLFIEELVASLVERSAPEAGRLPTSVRGIIAARLDAIPAAERTVLLGASVVGREFWDGALTRLMAAPEDLPALLDSLEDRDLVRRESASRFPSQRQYRFKHSMIREVAYAALPRARRREAHAAVAAFLEEQHAEREAPAALAHHLLEAGDRERAADFFTMAADQASRGWAKEEAAASYRQALELVPEGDVERRRLLRMKVAVTQMMIYHAVDAESLRSGSQPE
jgi:class 3 adenylate cyclase